jgi:hypothetical protein
MIPIGHYQVIDRSRRSHRGHISIFFSSAEGRFYVRDLIIDGLAKRNSSDLREGEKKKVNLALREIAVKGCFGPIAELQSHMAGKHKRIRSNLSVIRW